MTLPEELRQASLTALDHHRDLLERAAAAADAALLARQLLARDRDELALCHTGPNGIDVDGERGVTEYNAVISAIDAALSTQGEKT